MVVPPLLEKRLLHTLELLLFQQGCEYSSHFAPLPPDVWSTLLCFTLILQVLPDSRRRLLCVHFLGNKMLYLVGSILTLYFLHPSKGGSQRLAGGAEHPVGPAVAVPDAVPSVGEVLDPVSGQGQLHGVVAVARLKSLKGRSRTPRKRSTYPTTNSDPSADWSHRIREITSSAVRMRGFLFTSAGEGVPSSACSSGGPPNPSDAMIKPMNALVALCHFCELHGPRTLFCTEALHPPSPSPSSLAGAAGPGDRDRDGDREGEGLTMRANSSATQRGEMCEGCRSLPASHPGFVSIDDETGIRFLSHQHPRQPQLFSVVRQACVRSLSCEVCPGREGPIFFGDEQHGFVFSHTFFIKDSLARGFQRWYSIVMVAMDRIYLINSWPFLLCHLRLTIQSLQSTALKVFDIEQECVSPAIGEDEQCLFPCSVSTPKEWQRSPSLTSLTTIPTCGPACTPPSAGESTSSQRLLRQTGCDVDLCFHIVSRLLKACGSRLTEKLLEGAPTEDTLVLIERQTEQEEEMSCWEGAEGGDSTSQRHQSESNLGLDFLCDDAKLNELPGPKFRSLRHLRQVLGVAEFRQLVWHVLMGNQVIWRGADPGLIQSAFTVLKAVCARCHTVLSMKRPTNATFWVSAQMCIFLRTSAPQVPEPLWIYTVDDSTLPLRSAVRGFRLVQANFSVLVDVSIERNGRICAVGEYDISALYQFTISSPTLLNKLEVALSNENLSVDVVSHCLLCLKEEWMNKVKVLFKFSKVDGRGREDTQKVLALLGATGTGEEDNVRLLKFWMTGLSKTYKSHLMTAVRGGERSPASDKEREGEEEVEGVK
ncbi:hypothetical protein F7725_018381 [Dissostichus mawsoni]|uniref:Folliculin n=1 Tax=Dissostichus mawsoni TaxID=36200 RepID=A0A7J5XRC2_DISMA|nr:hypothetical protein F7725_018381 [Dissostichus mawsoni]